VGAPQQEMIARAALRRGDATGVGLCVGDALMRLAGRAPRAPDWARRFGLEGLHRLLDEPARLCRRAVADALRIAPIWYYWVRAALAERASISARNAF
jgi:UDP-N-acetyl-D-mannosaminuronic acid transferase (WecB/TagA/CpsF family)